MSSIEVKSSLPSTSTPIGEPRATENNDDDDDIEEDISIKGDDEADVAVTRADLDTTNL